MKGEGSNIYVLLEDDTEILGNGAGHVFYRQYLPVRRYLKTLNQLSIRSTFFIDAAHLLFLQENSSHSDFRMQANALIETVNLILQAGMDIQLHIHPQWKNAKICDGAICVTKEWNIGQLNQKDQSELVIRCYELLTQILKKSNPISGNRIIAYKAGSWGLQPFDTLYNDFKNLGIKLVFGPSKEIKIEKLAIDYTTMESELTPYYCDYDINKIGNKNDIIVVPLTPTYLNWPDFFGYSLSRRPRDNEIDNIPGEICYPQSYRSLFTGMNKLKLSRVAFRTHLKINSQPLWYLKKTFSRSYHEVAKREDFKLLVLETHTKDFVNHFYEVESFLYHIKEKYRNLQFITASDLNRKIESGECSPLIRTL